MRDLESDQHGGRRLGGRLGGRRTALGAARERRTRSRRGQGRVGAWEHSAKRNGQMENSHPLAEARTFRVLLPTAAFYGV